MKVYTFGQPRVGDKTFSDWVGKQFNTNNYYRVVNYDDMVPHLPPQAGSQYKHAGAEVWYSAKKYNGKYNICENKPGLAENKNCSNNLWLKIGITAHLNYFGMKVSGNCKVTQATGTRI